jgi:hypothetical protein
VQRRAPPGGRCVGLSCRRRRVRGRAMFSNTDAEWLNRGGHVRLIDRVKLKLGQETQTIAGFLLWQVSKLWQHRLTLALRDLGLASTQAVMLANVFGFQRRRLAGEAVLIVESNEGRPYDGVSNLAVIGAEAANHPPVVRRGFADAPDAADPDAVARSRLKPSPV